MSGLIAYGAYVPYHRLQRTDIALALGQGGGKGARAVASYDEDPTSMGVEAARPLLRGLVDGVRPERLLFATTDPPYLDKTNANVVHAALGLDQSVLAVDVNGSVRSGVGALVLAADSSVPTLAVMSDVRTGLPGGSDESQGGDGAVAFLFGDGVPPIAEIVAQASATEEFLDRWRIPGAPASKVWEERFGEHAYGPLADAAFADALKQGGITPADVDVLIVSGSHARANRVFAGHAGVAKVADDLTAAIGNAGTAQPGLVLASVLDTAAPGQTIVLVVLADGATAIVLRTTDAIGAHRSATSVADQIAAGGSVPYTRFLQWRGHLRTEPPRRPDPVGPAAPPTLRSGGYKYGFVGHRCTDCGFLHLPAVRVCVGCQSIDHMEKVPMADVEGTIATYTIDHLAYTPSPPVVAAVVDFDGGGRFSCEVTDVDPESIAIGDRVAMTFRKMVTAGDVHNYFWKARPAGPGTTDTKGV